MNKLPAAKDLVSASSIRPDSVSTQQRIEQRIVYVESLNIAESARALFSVSVVES